MGLFTALVTLPLAPMRGVAWVADQLLDVAEADLYDVGAIHAQLRELSDEQESGRISQAEFDRAEDVLLDRLQGAMELRPQH
jgi:hypothetical protein